MKLKSLSVLALALFIASAGCGCAQDAGTAGKSPAPFKTVEVAEFARLAADTNNLVLDVRTPREYAAGHLRGAMNLNLRASDFADRAARLDKGRTYLVHCAVGARSLSACQKLSEMSFTNLVNLRSGLKGWEAAGQPVVR